MGASEGSSRGADAEPVLDVRFHRCPLPVLKTRKALEALQAGAVLTVIATDPAARIDMAHFCGTSGHALLSVEEAEGVLTFVLRKG
jgi:tRNA 2-thiouridine synthesizing protein A